MGVTVNRRQLSWGTAALVLALAVLARRGGGPEGSPETATAENPLVIESPRLLVVSGSDTLSVVGPALFTYVGLDPDQEDPPARLVEAAHALQAALAEAEPGLRALGVQVIPVEQPPHPLGMAPETEAAAGPRLAPGTVGVLLADPQRRMMRMDRVTSGAALVCAAARTFGRTPPEPFAARCG